MRSKAKDLAALFSLRLGQPVSVKETLNCLKAGGIGDDVDSRQAVERDAVNWSELLRKATLTAFAEVSTTFELK